MRPVPRALAAVFLLLLPACAARTSRPEAPTISQERRVQQERLRELCLETMLSTIPDASMRARFCECSSEYVARSLPVEVLEDADSSREGEKAFRGALEQSFTECAREVGLAVEDAERASDSAAGPRAPSIVQIVAVDPSHRRVVTGSGFFITEHLVATNHHVVTTNPSAGIAREGADPFAAKVLYVDPALDFAVLVSPVEGEPLEIRETPVEDGEAVLAWGFPQGRRRIAFSSGTVRASDEVFIVHDAMIAAGSSGGPLTDAEGKVLGIVTFIAKSRGDAANESDRGIAVRMNLILRSVAARAKAGSDRPVPTPAPSDRTLPEVDLPPLLAPRQPRGVSVR